MHPAASTWPLSTGEEKNPLAEIFKSMERNVTTSMRGFYVMRVKKDPLTGHYIGVAAWVNRDQPLPGNRVIKPSAPEPVQKINDLPEQPSAPQMNTPFEQSSERAAQPQVEDSRSEFNQHVEKFNVERKPARNSVFDPYDSYEL